MKTTLRGSNVGGRTKEDIDALIATGANLIRWQIVGNINDPALHTWAGYQNWILDELEKLVPVLPLPDGVQILLEIHTPPAGLDGTKFAMFTTEPWGKQCLLDVWKMIAGMYKAFPAIIGYGILNEPRAHPNYLKPFMIQAVNTIRAVDKRKRICVTGPYSTPGSIKNCPWFPRDKYIWYETHFYDPLKLSHQGIYDYPAPVPYPHGTLNRAKLKAYMQPLFDFQAMHPTARQFIGEFAISNAATVQTQLNYLEDCIKLFEDLGAHWTYHAWREAPIWNKELVPPVLEMYKKFFERN